jgi:phytoene synthase
MSALADSTPEAAIAALLRRHDRDRYLLSLFVPAAARAAVQAIYAFNYEVARVRETVSEPLLGQIRLRWWRDGIAAAYEGKAVRHHEVLTPLAATIRRAPLNQGHFERLIDARERDLAEPPATVAALEAYADDSAAPLQLLVLEACKAGGPAANRAARDAAIAYALAGLLRSAAFRARSPRLALPPPLKDEAAAVAEAARRHLGAARAARADIPRAALPALLPAVLAAADLARLRRARFDPFAPAVARPDPWRAWRLAVAAALGRY